MGRPRLWTSEAERKRAYRKRLAAQRLAVRLAEIPAGKTGSGNSFPRSGWRGRRPSRPQRVAAVHAAVVQLFDEYEDWRASLPKSLHGSTQARRLSDTIDQLAAVIDLLSDLELPRGFGWD